MTTNPRIRRVYYGPASVTSPDYHFADAEDSHIPLALASDRWLGVVHDTPDGLILEAFAEVDFEFGTTHRAFCPEWDDGLDDEDVWLFEVTVPAP